ncbi:M13-type metalloendopeptidase [Butyrivibrio sp. YAB3001]|uniref:M13-type metalloendopeptidase n=1 Tax=Butyrivibrio sp. YAB3001 TaxID=1520812 RepID=UPI0008F6325E|nr:M13-type metalloendopeptidase [Butyrivibrio sp. YAB3001]SFD05522.1 Predicted metalloendopeptidase [Butyrivibrio sp. YAB3001]
MKKRNKIGFIRVFTVFFSALMLFESTGCGAKEAAQAEVVNEPENEVIEKEQEGQAEQSKETNTTGNSKEEADSKNAQKEYVWDFDALVNDEYKETLKEKAESTGYDSFFYSWENNLTIAERVTDILSNTDLSTLSEDSDLDKTIYVYRQLKDDDWRENNASAAIKEVIDPVEKVRSLDDLYALFSDKYYEKFNRGLSRYVYYNQGCSLNYINPQMILGKKELTEDQVVVLKDYLVRLGYSENRAAEIMDNALEIDKQIEDYQNSIPKDSYMGYLSKKRFEEENVKFPLFDILQKIGALGNWEEVYTNYEFCKFADDYYNEKNALKIRDHVIASMALNLSGFDSDEVHSLFYDAFSEGQGTIYKDAFALDMVDVATDTLIKEYNARYLDDAYLEKANEMLEEIKISMRDIIADSEWLTSYGKECARRKILHLNTYICENSSCDDFSEVVLTDNPLQNMIALQNSRSDFLNSQLLLEDENMKLYGYTILEMNASYQKALNGIVIGCGYFDHGLTGDDYSYEEKLAYLGHTFAHEIAHAYDREGIQFDKDGYYEPWLTEEEGKAFLERVGKIKEFFDGMEIADGITLNGEVVCNETFADLMGMECCLRILENKENPDYDLFFRTYARYNACYYNEKGLKEDAEERHLPRKERINYVLGQFEKFYETYDVDSKSPYFVPEDKRLPVF